LDLKETIDLVLQSPQRKLIVAENDIDLDTNMRNDIFILMVVESQGSAGGRAGGSGSRRIDRVVGFSCKDGICVKYYEASDREKVELFNIPYSAVAMDIKLSKGESIVVQGIVDPELIEAYKAIAKNKQ
jgi:hypothetical protein